MVVNDEDNPEVFITERCMWSINTVLDRKLPQRGLEFNEMLILSEIVLQRGMNSYQWEFRGRNS